MTAEDDSKIAFVLDDDCKSLVHRVVRCRQLYYPYLKKMTKNLVHLEKQYFKKKIRNREAAMATENHEFSIDASRFEYSFSFRDEKSFCELDKEIDNLKRVYGQIEKDPIHRLQRESVSSESIMNKVIAKGNCR